MTHKPTQAILNMIHPDTYVRPTSKKGLGLFAKRKFRRGEILWIADDFDVKIPLLNYRQVAENQRRILDIYSYMDNFERVIVPWDEGKYVNHSCAPNSTGIIEFDNLTIAFREIQPFEEIVEDYHCYFAHFETFICRCGTPNCRGLVGCEDPYEPQLRLHLGEIVDDIFSYPQPLLSYKSVENIEFLRLLEQFKDIKQLKSSYHESQLNGHCATTHQRL